MFRFISQEHCLLPKCMLRHTQLCWLRCGICANGMRMASQTRRRRKLKLFACGPWIWVGCWAWPPTPCRPKLAAESAAVFRPFTRTSTLGLHCLRDIFITLSLCATGQVRDRAIGCLFHLRIPAELKPTSVVTPKTFQTYCAIFSGNEKDMLFLRVQLPFQWSDSRSCPNLASEEWACKALKIRIYLYTTKARPKAGDHPVSLIPPAGCEGDSALCPVHLWAHQSLDGEGHGADHFDYISQAGPKSWWFEPRSMLGTPDPTVFLAYMQFNTICIVPDCYSMYCLMDEPLRCLALLQEPWLDNPDSSVPDERSCQIASLAPAKVKKELSDQANLVKVFGKDSGFVKPGLTEEWSSGVPPAIVEELEKMSGWSRCEEQKCFTVTMPSHHTDLVFWDSEPVPSSGFWKHVYYKTKTFILEL